MFFQIILILLVNFYTIFLKIYEPEIFSVFNEDPYRELQNGNDKGQQNADILSKYAHFFTWKTSVYISIIAQKNTTISLKVEMNSCIE